MNELLEAISRKGFQYGVTQSGAVFLFVRHHRFKVSNLAELAKVEPAYRAEVERKDAYWQTLEHDVERTEARHAQRRVEMRV